MNAPAQNALQQLEDDCWFEIGREAAPIYARDQEWLFRRVETIEFVDRRSVKRTVTVDFEIPEGHRSLHRHPKRPGPKETFLVPIAMMQKWPPTMNFQMVDEHGTKLSRYRGSTTKRVNFGLLIGVIDLALGGPKEKKAEQITPRLRRDLAEIVDDPQPSQVAVARVVNELNEQLEDLRQTTAHKRCKDAGESANGAAAALDLAARLSSGSILWVAVTGPHRSDRLVTFSYQGAHLIKAPKFDEDKDHPERRAKRPGRASAWWNRLAISCSWRGRTMVIPLLHGGKNVRYHLNIGAPAGSVEMHEASAVLLPAAEPSNDRSAETEALSVATLAAIYDDVLEQPDEWVGPESNGYFMAYGAPKVLASTDPDKATPGDCGPPEDAAALIIDRRAHIYSGAEGASSHRMLLQLRLKAAREGLITACLLASAAIAALMVAILIRLPEAAEHVDATAVLLSIVPLVLGYVVVQPDEQPFEHEHLRGVRLMALLSGALPIIGALCLVLAHDGHTHGAVRWIWAGLAGTGVALFLLLLLSFRLSAPPEQPTEPTPGKRP
jgi:hypothetical protein